MKTHYASLQRANESDNNNYWSETVCGTKPAVNDLGLTDCWGEVTCKKCLKQKSQHEQETKEAMEHSCRDMAGFLEFIYKNKLAI